MNMKLEGSNSAEAYSPLSGDSINYWITSAKVGEPEG